MNRSGRSGGPRWPRMTSPASPSSSPEPVAASDRRPRALVRRGAQVTLVDLCQPAVDTVAGEPLGGPRAPLAGDVTRIEQMTGVTDAAVHRFGKVDVVFANTGIANAPPRRRFPQ